MSREHWARARRINAEVNRLIVRRSDAATYGVSDRWATPLENGARTGDCEDFALEKRRALIAAGIPPEALNLALVTTARGEAHAVLLLATDRGEFVLDSLTAWIVPWDQARYRWRIRQHGGLASAWIAIANPLRLADAS